MNIIMVSVLFFIGVIILAHFFSQPGYHWTVNTVSDLAAQGHKNKWIMQAGFIGFGILLNLGFVNLFILEQQVIIPDILIMIFGISVLLSGIFCTKPIEQSLNYSKIAAQWHSNFAFVAGLSFNMAIVWYIFEANSLTEKIFHVLFMIAIMGTSALFGLAENGRIKIGKGLIQKVMYLISFVWLFIVFR
jgi:hypothetical membrane protein